MKKLTTIIIISFILLQGMQHAGAQNWKLTGNAGTDPGTQFIGTTDNKAFKIRTNNNVRMTINSSGKVGIGVTSPNFKLDVKGSINTDSSYRIGGSKVLSVDLGNTYVGLISGYSNTSGYFNTATGLNSLYLNTIGNSNTATGANSLFSNSTGNYNTASGESSLFSNTTGFDNTALGVNALYSNTTGYYNTASGVSSLYNNITGYENTANGNTALYSNTTGSYNTANGYAALYNNTIGGVNTANGFAALYYNTTGNDNVANGYIGLYYNTTGSLNTAIGDYSLWTSSASDGNTAVGYFAGGSWNNGYYNTYIGSDANANGPDYYNSIAIGNTSRVTAPLQVRIGSSIMASIGGYQNWSNVSDGRYKKNVKEDVKGLEFIMKLRPVTYNLDVTGLSQKLNENGNGLMDNPLEKDAMAAKEKVICTGFIAQEVEKAAQEIGYDFSGVDKPKNDDDLYGLRYAEFVVPLVKAVQELDKVNEDLKSQNEQLSVQNESLTQRIEKLESLVGANAKFSESSISSMPLLEQNSPNPFNGTTTIRFSIPASAHNTELKISSVDGKELASFPISTTGAGQIEINGNTLSAGVYNYTLLIDGRVIDSRQMVLTK